MTPKDFFNHLKNEPPRLAVLVGTHQITVERWRKFGVPLKYWEALIKEYDLTPGELHSFNLRVTNRRAK